MSLSLSCARATITKFKADKKANDDGSKRLTSALKIELKTSADILAEFHPSLRAALFLRDGGVRFRSMKEIGWDGTRRDVEIAIRPGPDIKPALTLSSVTLRDFRFKPIEEGSQQFVAMKFMADLDETTGRVSTLLEYLQEEAWIDISGGGELDLAPPSARTEIEGLQDEPAPKPSPGTVTPGAKYSVVKESDVAAVRRMQPTPKGVQAKLKGYHDEVLRAALAAEAGAANSRPMFISMLEAELKRRLASPPAGGAA